MSHTLPREIVGLTRHNCTTAIPPCAALRTHDFDADVQWQRIERDPGVYSWADWDSLVAECRAAGLVLIDTIIGTPSCYATSKQQDAYGFSGGASMPSDLGAMRRFVFERIRRANVKRKSRVVTIIEPWNEPSLFFEPCMNEPPDWRALVEVARTVCDAARSADPGIKVATPSMLAGHPEHLAGYLAAGGGKCADYANVHAYGHDLPAIQRTLQAFRAILADAGYADMPIAFTECGHQPRWDPPFLKLTQAQQRREWADIMLYLASEGCTAFVSYSVDPGKQAVDSGEVYPMTGNAWGEAPGLVLPYVGKKIRKAAAWSPGNRAWVIGGRTVRIEDAA